MVKFTGFLTQYEKMREFRKELNGYIMSHPWEEEG
jgi:hypothetical protein